MKTQRAPWVPFAGVHAGFLKGYTAAEMLTDADKAFDALMEVNRLYRPDGQPVIFDLQIEAECLGCDLKWVDDCPPSVLSHPLAKTMRNRRRLRATARSPGKNPDGSPLCWTS